ncbi:MAG TPA: chloride channel protein [Acidobacteriaceae bacterium]
MKANLHGEHRRRQFKLGLPEIFWAAWLGLVSGTAAALVRLVFRALQWVFTQHTGMLPDAAATLSPWRKLATPVAGALLAAAVLALRRARAQRLARKPRPFIEYVSAVRLAHGRIPLIPNLWRTGSSAFSVASGAAIGREGSMIQFAAAVTSATARKICERWPSAERFPTSLGVACGVAGGVATAYSAPLAGVFFAAEVALGGLRRYEIVPLLCASCTGWLVSRLILGPGPLYAVHPELHLTPFEFVLLAIVALAMGMLGPLYQRLIRSLRAASKLPMALLWGGLAVGGLSLLDARVWGNGDVGLDAALGRIHGADGVLAMKGLMILLLLRLVATTICVGTGTVGGVFTPTLFAGAALGLAAGRLMHTQQPIVFAVLGMTCLIAAVTHAPLMATLMAVELTGDWRMLPLLLLGSLIAWQIARRLSKEALYALASEEPAEQHFPAPHEQE